MDETRIDLLQLDTASNRADQMNQSARGHRVQVYRRPSTHSQSYLWARCRGFDLPSAEARLMSFHLNLCAHYEPPISFVLFNLARDQCSLPERGCSLAFNAGADYNLMPATDQLSLLLELGTTREGEEEMPQFIKRVILWAYLGQWLLSVSQFVTSGLRGDGSSATTIHKDNSTTRATGEVLVEVKIGFLVGSRRLDHDHTYSRPGRQLKYAFNFAIDKFNQLNSDSLGQQQAADDVYRQTKSANSGDDDDDGDGGGPATRAAPPKMVSPLSSSNKSAGIKIKLAPIIKETFGSESESIKQTIELITKHGVNFIFGPQETCQIEPKLASIFDVAMLSHYCTRWASYNDHDIDHTDQNQRIKLQSNAIVGGHQGKSPALPPASVTRQQSSEPPSGRTTFIQIKPPHWKIVSRVVALVEQLLAVSYEPPDRNNNGIRRTLYPQQLVLLYFKEPSAASKQWPAATSGADKSSSLEDDGDHYHYHDDGDIAAAGAGHNRVPPHLATVAATDAIQYRLIGELLEIKLNQLVNQKRKQYQLKDQRPTLSALNWHTTFHYGYTKNPFRAVLRRHLFRVHHLQHKHRSSSTNQSATTGHQCDPTLLSGQHDHKGSRLSTLSPPANHRPLIAASKSRSPPQRPTEAIYIVVGHYYEHLGLMLALNELNLLPTAAAAAAAAATTTTTTTTASSAPSVHDDQTQEFVQSSVGMTATMMGQPIPSVVIGVDTEPYDERDDSVRFLRGLLMDSVGGGDGSGGQASSSAQPGDDLDSDTISTLYRAYLGVVPANPAHQAEFLDEMRSLYANETLVPSIPLMTPDISSLTEANNQTQQQQQQQQRFQLNARLLQFIRLPVEAFYLYDAVMLLGLYLKDCLLKWGPNGLSKCSQGNRTFDWFRGRDYVSHVTHNWSRFDSLAQAEGSYNLITRRKQTPIDPATAANNQDDDSNGSGATLIQIGYFSTDRATGNNKIDPNSYSNSRSVNPTIDRIELHLSSWDEVDPIWLPFWCHVRKNFTSNACLHLIQANLSSQMDGDSDDHLDQFNPVDTKSPSVRWSTMISGDYPWLTVLIVVSCSLIVILLYLVRCLDNKQRRQSGSKTRSKSFNAGWFSESDERNFLELIYRYILAPEANESLDVSQAVKEQTSSRHTYGKDLLEIHCNMFAFPSCVFVHWLSAMYQLKEMLFKFKSNDITATSKTATAVNVRNIGGILRTITVKLVRLIRSASFSTVSSPELYTIERQFFSTKHSGTNSLRLLLNKYKLINECLINLAQLDHNSVARLHGVTMSCNVAAAPGSTRRTVFLVLDRPDRGNLRQAWRQLTISESPCQSNARSSKLSMSWMKFKDSLIASLLRDILDGLEYLHDSIVGFHGDLRSTSCLIAYDWRLKLSGFHVNHLRRSLGDYELKLGSSSSDSCAHFDRLIYSAPELIRIHHKRGALERESMQLVDIYSFAFVAYEILADGLEPWTSCSKVRDSKLIVDRVKDDASFRPSLSKLDLMRHRNLDSDNVQRTIRSCWSHSPDRRPQSIAFLRARLSSNGKLKFSDANELMCNYTKLIELSYHRQRKYSTVIKRHILSLKLSRLPANIVAKLCRNQTVKRQRFECVSFGMFRLVFPDDICSSPVDPMENLSQFMCEMLRLVDQYQSHLHLLDSQADSLLRFMVISGEPLNVAQEKLDGGETNQQRVYPSNYHSQLVASFALQLIDLVVRLQASGNPVQIRCGLHCGPVFGGLLAFDSDCKLVKGAFKTQRQGEDLARYILIGPTMLFANLLEQTSQSQRIQISAEFRTQLLLAERLLPSLSLSSIETTSKIKPASLEGLESRQGYVIIKREAKIQPSKILSSGSGSCASEFEAYWLLNGPRLTASQSLMLLTKSCDTLTVNRSGDISAEWALEALVGGYDSDYDDDDDWRHHDDDWTHPSHV